MTKAILSTRYPEYAEQLSKRGYETIPSDTVENFIGYEQDHADMQCLILDDTAFVLRCCEGLINRLKSTCNVVLCGDDIQGEYPRNVALNAAQVGKTLICRTDTLDDRVKDYCRKYGYELLRVRQGYAKCSCTVVSDHAIITADNGIYQALQGSKIEILLIEQGRVALKGAEYGFIGGASGYDRNAGILYFTGNINTHPDAERILYFCEKQHTKVISLSDNPLVDTGGILFC